MNKEDLFNLVITPPCGETARRIKARWDSISKPLDGFGDFETVIARIGAMQGRDIPDISRRCVVIMCADNGIVKEGVSQCGSKVTGAVAAAIGKGTGTVSTLARAARADCLGVDIGIDSQDPIPGIRNEKITRGTASFLEQPAMSEEQVLAAIETGIRIAGEQAQAGYKLLAAGEMGIGNTTTATAVLCALLDLSCETLVGRGAGLDGQGLKRKTEVIRKGLARLNFTDFESLRLQSLEILRTLGGLDIAGMTGLYIGGALNRMPVIIDGLISSAAALLAERLVPGTKAYMIPSISGREAGTAYVLNELGLFPFINGDMALGEGTGALMLLPLLDLVLSFYTNASCFSDIKVEAYERYDT